MAAGMEWNMNGILTPPFNIFTISYYMYIIFVHKILNSRSYSGHAKVQDDLTIILENPQIRIFSQNFEKG